MLNLYTITYAYVWAVMWQEAFNTRTGWASTLGRMLISRCRERAQNVKLWCDFAASGKILSLLHAWRLVIMKNTTKYRCHIVSVGHVLADSVNDRIAPRNVSGSAATAAAKWSMVAMETPWRRSIAYAVMRDARDTKQTQRRQRRRLLWWHGNQVGTAGRQCR